MRPEIRAMRVLERHSDSASPGLRGTGFTLTELLVSTAVLTMLILLTGGMLTQTQRTIRAAQATIKANANGRAVADRFRRDVESMLQDGFLLISSDMAGNPRLVFLAAGVYQSMVTPTFVPTRPASSSGWRSMAGRRLGTRPTTPIRCIAVRC